VGVFKDVTVVRELEAQAPGARTGFAALGTLAAGFAHEIKNPITSLRTFTRLVSRKFNDEHFRQTFEKVVPRELERINGSWSACSSSPGPPVEPKIGAGPLSSSSGSWSSTPTRLRPKQITVLREYAHDLPTIRGDAEHLYQAFLNLVANAFEAMSTGGRLTLRAGWSDDRDWLPSSRRAPERSVKVEIGDTGTGIASSETDKIFNPFFTTKEGGTGLGLALVHKIIEDHGGSITFRSSAGVGTTF